MLPVLLALLLQQPFQVPATGSADLAGLWRFHAGDSAAFARPDAADTGWVRVAVPGHWPAGTSGFGWYRARFALDTMPSEPIGIRVASVEVAWQLFVDGELIGELGGFPPRYRARSATPVVVPLPPALVRPGAHTIALRVYSGESRGGITGDVTIGSMSDLQADDLTLDGLFLGMALLLVGIGLGQIVLWSRRDDARVHLALAALCAALALFFVVWMPATRVAVSPVVFWFRLFMAFGAAALAAACFAFRRLFDLEDDRLLLVFGLFFLAVAALAVFVPAWDDLRLLESYLLDPGALLFGAGAVAVAARQRLRGSEHVAPVLWGALLFAVAIILNVLAGWGLFSLGSSYPWLLLVGCVAFVLGLTASAGHRLAEAETAALYDRLTGLYRREVVMDALQREIRRAARVKQAITVIMMDVDRFKQINDTLGHQAGDRVLAEIGRRLGEAGRAVDWLGRYGGEEFVAVLASTSVDGGILAAERLRQAVSALPIATGRTSKTITLSAGVAAFDGKSEWPTTEQLVGAADAALYRAKDQGRNTIAT